MNKYAQVCQAFVRNYLGRSWSADDGLPEKDVRKAESRLGIRLPTAMRTFYLSVGNLADLYAIHNYILPPKDLKFEEGYLIFMDENQNVVSWGLKKEDLKKADPEAWQRNNSSDEWYSEKKTFTELLTSMFDWYKQLGVWTVERKDG